MTTMRSHSLTGGSVALLLLGLGACGEGVPGRPSPSPSPSPLSVTNVIHSDSFAVGIKTVVSDPFTTTAMGTLEVTVDWTFAANDVDIFLARGTDACTLETFNNRTCGFLATAESLTLKPEKLTIANLTAGAYTLYVANYGATNESVGCQIVLTSGATAGAPSVHSLSAGRAAAKGMVKQVVAERFAS